MQTESRLDRLERANSRLTAAVVVLASIVVVGFCGGAGAVPPIVTARSFRLMDHRDKVVGMWNITDDGNPTLTMWDKMGSPRIIIAATRDMGGIHFYDDRERHAGSIFGTNVTRTIEEAERVNLGK